MLKILDLILRKAPRREGWIYPLGLFLSGKCFPSILLIIQLPEKRAGKSGSISKTGERFPAASRGAAHCGIPNWTKPWDFGAKHSRFPAWIQWILDPAGSPRGNPWIHGFLPFPDAPEPSVCENSSQGMFWGRVKDLPCRSEGLGMNPALSQSCLMSLSPSLPCPCPSNPPQNHFSRDF